MLSGDQKMTQPTLPHQRQVQRLRELLQSFRIESHLVDATASQRHDLESSLVHRQQAVELERRLRGIHTADLADLMESLPTDDRWLVWLYLPDQRRGEVLLELDDAVRENLVSRTPEHELLSILTELDADDLAYLGDALPEEILKTALENRASEEKRWVQASLAYDEESVGHWMSSDMLVVRRDQSLALVQAQLQQRDSLPVHTDKLLVTDQRGSLCGVLLLQDILLNSPESQVSEVMKSKPVSFSPDTPTDDAARAFERYDLASAPVVNERGKLIGRLTVDAVMDYVREQAEMDTLNIAGVLEGEDLFAGVWASARNRWLWLAINLATAFVISRIIGAFEGVIVQLVALASLMPVVASVAGNTGNQTTALVIRSLAMDQVNADNVRHLFRKELAISALNGAVWGLVIGIFAYIFYQSIQLSAVLMLAMTLTLIIAAVFGVGAPLLLERLGRDPAMGSSVILTGLVDALGFFILLTLASTFLV
jgi:magnesium transporter